MRGIESVCLSSGGLLMLGMQGNGKAQLVMKDIGFSIGIQEAAVAQA